MPLTPETLHDVFSHHAPDEAGLRSIQKIRDAAEAFATVILYETPTCADQSVALRCVRNAMMNANAAIALKGLI